MTTSIKPIPSTPDTTRALILDTALGLFSRTGYFNTSVQDIRKEADISIGSIYHHFPSKEAIAKAIYHDLLAQMEEAMRNILATHASAYERCRAAVALLLSMADSQPAAMEFILNARHREFMSDGVPICSSSPFALMKQMVQEGMEQGEIALMDPLVAATSLFGGPIRMIYLRLDGLIDGEVSRHLEPVWQCSWKSVSR
ncbi:TetR/AcrR family transcriptional regulator [Desulfuromonas sp. AOP6]|uniref:TetR/AcrR family transcriptional regulator n=1 Tax=Desulfuromonas sp. AOP6 TaxID=1566351 RepID=UPI001BCB59A6|nr:TetR/AcrR family transcriptional regulator [Desulfuromonas sp. AOP6]